jgi:hypothetical protein
MRHGVAQRTVTIVVEAPSADFDAFAMVAEAVPASVRFG